jgi:signal transduction histidine kinase
MIDTVIRNLTANALKFTPHGGSITIAAQVREVRHESSLQRSINDANLAFPYILPSSSEVEVSVADTGVGIAAEDVEKLFKIEVHHTTLGTNKEQGTGLGLVMCHEMVRKNGGDIWVESVLGEGTQFKFTVPWATIPISTEDKEQELS